MFHNSNRELDRLARALQEVEEPEESYYPEEDSEDPDYEDAFSDELLPGENPAVDFSRTVWVDEEDAPSYRRRRGPSRADSHTRKQLRRSQAPERKKRRKKKKGIGGLVLLALAEIAAILWILRWWIIWLT